VRVTNAGNMTRYGSELELIFIPVADMTVGTAIGYDKAEYDSFDTGQCAVEQTFYQYYITDNAQGGSPATNSSCTQDLAGKPLANAPEWTVSTCLQHNIALPSELAGALRLTVSDVARNLCSNPALVPVARDIGQHTWLAHR